MSKYLSNMIEDLDRLEGELKFIHSVYEPNTPVSRLVTCLRGEVGSLIINLSNHFRDINEGEFNEDE